MSLRTILTICIALAASNLACSQQMDTARDQADAADTSAAAQINGEALTVAELDAWIKERLFEQATDEGDPGKLYELRSRALEDLINERLLEEAAKPLGLTTEDLLRLESEKKTNIGDEEVLAFYEENKERMGDVAFEDVSPRIRRHLQQQREQTAGQEYIAALRNDASVVVHLDAPRIDVEATGASLGPEDAPVTIIEFSDYQCPYCKRAEPVIQQVLERYPSQVRFVYRHFPLDRIHPLARGAAEAAACANDQGRFWEFHGNLFGEGAEFDKENLLRYASDAGLDLVAFQACVDERRFQDAVEADVVDGQRAGVTGTPAFFINGIQIKGVKPIEEFVTIIEKELERAGS
jgi:protein-disulfide isomerase